MNLMANYDNIVGIIYTTWVNDYTKLEDFGDMISGYGSNDNQLPID